MKPTARAATSVLCEAHGVTCKAVGVLCEASRVQRAARFLQGRDDFFRPVEEFAPHGVSFSEPGVDFLAGTVGIVQIGDQFEPGGADFDLVVEERTAPAADLALPGTPFSICRGDYVRSAVENVAQQPPKACPLFDFFVPGSPLVLARGT